GYGRRVRETPSGGKVVWLRDEARGQSLYYAHLDSQLVADGMWVEPGDTVGLVGNTGNARTTPPHLHFGIYRRGEGPVDPYWFLYRPPAEPPRLAVDTASFGKWTRAARDGIRLRAAPADGAPALAELPRHTAMRVLAGTGSWYRVRLPDGTVGFVAGRLLEQADDAVASERVATTLALRSVPLPDAIVVDSIAPGAEVPVLGRFGAYLFVQAPDGRTGWVELNRTAAGLPGPHAPPPGRARRRPSRRIPPRSPCRIPALAAGEVGCRRRGVRPAAPRTAAGTAQRMPVRRARSSACARILPVFLRDRVPLDLHVPRDVRDPP